METTDEWNKVIGFLADKVAQTGSYTHYYIGHRKESTAWKWTEAGSPGVTVATDDSRWQTGQSSDDSRAKSGIPVQGPKGTLMSCAIERMQVKELCQHVDTSVKIIEAKF